jgi:uncharacterized protein (DUF2062 family)
MKNIIKKIPEKSKQLWNRIKTDWTTLSAPEKVGFVALALATTIPVSLAGMEGLRRFREHRAKMKLERVV